MLLPPDERDEEIKYLKEKIDAGCDLIFTQMFYDVEIFISWVKAVRAAGITVPIVPGIAPIQTWKGFQRATSLAKTVIPQHFLDSLEPVKNDDERVREVGVTLVADLCRRILKEDIGIRGLHFYTMNLERATKMLLEELNLVPRVETIKPLPWRQVRPETNKTHNPRSYSRFTRSLSHRTEDKRTFAQSSGSTERAHTLHERKTGTSTRTVVLVTLAVQPSASWMVTVFGSNKRYVGLRSCFTLHRDVNIILFWSTQKEEGLGMWGYPTSFNDICKLFSKFCTAETPGLPWSDEPPSSEMLIIRKQLARLNDYGFLTINSQPAVDGTPSNDKVFGWGPRNGYVYQKVRCVYHCIAMPI